MSKNCKHILNSGYWKEFCSECGLRVIDPQCGTCGHKKSEHFEGDKFPPVPKYCCDGCGGFDERDFYRDEPDPLSDFRKKLVEKLDELDAANGFQPDGYFLAIKHIRDFVEGK